MDDAAARLRQLSTGHWMSQAIHVAAVLGVADLLADGPRTNDELAQATETHPRSLYRLLRALASVDVLQEGDGRRFSLVGRPYIWESWSAPEHTVRTGETAFHHVHGTDVWTTEPSARRRA